MENWKPIEGCDRKYWINDSGDVFSTKNKIVLSSSPAPNGYFGVNILRHSKLGNSKIHRMVAETFIPNPCNKPEVNHKNGIKSDNRAENLEWVTRKENAAHAAANNMYPQGEENHSAKLKADLIIKIRIQHERGATQVDLGKLFGVSQKSIHQIVYRKTWKHVA